MTSPTRHTARKPKRRWPLQADFAAVAVVVILGGVAAGTFVHIRSEAEARRLADQDAQFAAQKAAAQFQASSESIQAITQPVANNPDTAAVFTLGQCSVAYGPIGLWASGHIDIIRLDGSVVCSSLKPANTTIYKGAWLSSSSPVVVAPTLDPATGKQVAIYAYPIAGKGAVVWFFDLNSIGPKLATEFGSGVNQLEFLIVSDDGSTVVTRSIDPGKWTGAKLAGTPFAASTTSSDRQDVQGTQRWYGQAKVKTTGWTVYAGADKATALAGARGLKNEQLQVVGAGILAVLLALLIVYQRVARPIASLSLAVRSSSSLGTSTPVPVRGPAQVAGLGEDINTLIASLTSAERMYAQLFERSPLPIVIVDSESLACITVNDAAIQAFGYSRDEFKGLDLSALDVTTSGSGSQSITDLLAGEDPKPTQFGPLSLRKQDGSTIQALVTTYGIEYGGRQVRVMALQDVTEKERLERQRNQSQRLESLGQLAGGVAHDFNNLLGAILNFALFAKEKVASAAASTAANGHVSAKDLQSAANDMDRVIRAGESAARLTHQLLAFARREVVRPQALDVNSVVGELEPLLRRTLGEHIEFVTSLDPGLWRALMDPGQLEQVLTNLAINARDAMPNGGKLEIDTENVEVDEAYAAGRQDLKPGHYVRLRVSDTGTGMDDQTLQRLFEPFFTTKPKGRGTGLGLATVHGIIRQAGGHIAIYSELGRGTRVSALLPATEVAPVQPAAPTPPKQQHTTGTVLVVEDSDDLREVAELLLNRNGYEVLSAPDGPAAIQLVHDRDGAIDLLLTDVVMPKMQGRELADRIAAMRPGIRVLYMSGFAEPMLGASGTLEPGVVLLEKPFTEDELLTKVRQALDHAASR